MFEYNQPLNGIESFINDNPDTLYSDDDLSALESLREWHRADYKVSDKWVNNEKE